MEVNTMSNKNDNAVSPVVGTIFLVAITVALAAIVAVFVFGMAGQIQTTKIVTVTMHRVDPGSVTFTYMGGQDAPSLNGIYFSVNGKNATLTVPSGGMVVTGGPLNKTLLPATGTILPVGATVSIAAPIRSSVTAIGIFTDGTSQVLLTETL